MPGPKKVESNENVAIVPLRALDPKRAIQLITCSAIPSEIRKAAAHVVGGDKGLPRPR